MKKSKKILQTIRAVLVLIWALILFLSIPLFFINYNGRWMHVIAEKLPIKERQAQTSCTPDQQPQTERNMP